MPDSLHFEQMPLEKLPLIKRFYKQHYSSTKPKPDELTILAYQDLSMAGVVRFRPVGETFLLTGMAIDSELRGQGIGTKLIEHCKQAVLDERYYCFALEHLTQFYTKSGFIELETEQLPNDLRVLFKRYTRNGRRLVPMHYAK